MPIFKAIFPEILSKNYFQFALKIIIASNQTLRKS